jgi:hypothetical protein
MLSAQLFEYNHFYFLPTYNFAVCFGSRARMILCWLILAIHLPSRFHNLPVENVRPAPPFSVCCSCRTKSLTFGTSKNRRENSRVETAWIASKKRCAGGRRIRMGGLMVKWRRLTESQGKECQSRVHDKAKTRRDGQSSDLPSSV